MTPTTPNHALQRLKVAGSHGEGFSAAKGLVRNQTVCEPSWRKFAMILAKTHDKLTGLPVGNEGHRLIAKRIQRLVDEGDW